MNTRKQIEAIKIRGSRGPEEKPQTLWTARVCATLLPMIRGASITIAGLIEAGKAVPYGCDAVG